MQGIILSPVATVKNSVHKKKDISWSEETSSIILNDEYITGLNGLEDFSHCIIVFYLDKADYKKEKHLQRRPQNRSDMPIAGIFSQRCKDRPNKIGITAVEIVSVSDNELVVKGLDAVYGTAVLDIKPYYPVYDKKSFCS